VGDDNPARAIDVFVDELDLGERGFGGVEPRAMGRPGLLKILPLRAPNRVQASRRIERECQRNVELVWVPAARLSRGLPPNGRYGSHHGGARKRIGGVLLRRGDGFSGNSLRKARPLAVGRRLYLSAGDGMAVLVVKHFL
jgi:hypothetical protein